MKELSFIFLMIIVLFSCSEISTDEALHHVKKNTIKLLEQNNLNGDKFKVEIDSSELKIPKDFFKRVDSKTQLIIPMVIGYKKDSMYLKYFLSKDDFEDNFLSVQVSPKLYNLIDSSQSKRQVPVYKGFGGVYIKVIE
ncbi:hypothetical protein [Apibacter sp. HY039]|uniref:hypothetical protein n=1 Tax=Apibacter sp. HY039 TaxID=2501476 RepID=UPI000FEB86BC|nr:hypothetical protein [Apibacter sp. HY039]